MNKKNIYIIGGVVVLLVLVIGGYLMMGNKTAAPADTTKNVLPQSEVVPTVDSSVEVSVNAQNNKHDIFITVKNVPAGTTDIDFEMNYMVKKTLPQGSFGKLEVSGNTATNTKVITLGTCSSGTCVYHEGVESVEVILMFNSESGAKTYKKEFPL